MRDYNISLSATTLFLARIVRITRLDGWVLRIAEAEQSIAVGIDELFVPLPGAEVVSHGLRLRAEGGHDHRGRVRIGTVLVSPDKREENGDG